jgi:hypothetical protein
VYYGKVTRDKYHIAKSSNAEIQAMLDIYAKDNWLLISTDMSQFGVGLYVYLYFEREVVEES